MTDELYMLQQHHGGVQAPSEMGEAEHSHRIAHFGEAASEYRTAKEEAVLFDVSTRDQLELTGGDRQKFLHNFCTNDINKLQPGEGCEAIVTNVKGRILGHIFVFLDDESLWIETVPGVEESLLQHLDRYLITEDVELHGRTTEVGELYVSGPEAGALLTQFDTRICELPLYGHARVTVGKLANIHVRRVDWFNQPGFLLSIDRVELPGLWNLLNEEARIMPGGAIAFETLRIEAGFPRYGIDISEENIAQEASRTEQAISFTKGCYLGQEPIARLDALGHVNRQVSRLRVKRLDPITAGTKLIAGEDSKEVGLVTSSAEGFDGQSSVAIATLRREFAKPGSHVVARTSDGEWDAEVI